MAKMTVSASSTCSESSTASICGAPSSSKQNGCHVEELHAGHPAVLGEYARGGVGGA